MMNNMASYLVASVVFMDAKAVGNQTIAFMHRRSSGTWPKTIAASGYTGGSRTNDHPESYISSQRLLLAQQPYSSRSQQLPALRLKFYLVTHHLKDLLHKRKLVVKGRDFYHNPIKIVIHFYLNYLKSVMAAILF